MKPKDFTINLMPQDNLVCPYCREKADGTASGAGGAPRPGDLSLCGFCLNVSLFEPNGNRLTLRAPTPAEMEDIETNEPEMMEEIRKMKADNFPLWKYYTIDLPTGPTN